MAHSRSAEKRIRQNEKRRLANKAARSTVKTQEKKFLAAIAAGDMSGARAEYLQTISIVDRAAKRGLYHPNYAARKKSRLLKMIKPPSGTGGQGQGV